MRIKSTKGIWGVLLVLIIAGSSCAAKRNRKCNCPSWGMEKPISPLVTNPLNEQTV